MKKLTKTDISKKRMINALEKSMGIVTKAAKITGMSREQHYHWLRVDEEYKEKVDAVGEMAIDFAESKLFEQINEGSVPSTIFYLKTKGRARGYVEQYQIKDITERPLFSFKDAPKLGEGKIIDVTPEEDE